ncbi:MAG: hypothetical protein ACM3MK_13705 [Chitinophagales bacterium]
MLAFLVLSALALATIEGLPLYRERRWKELGLYTILVSAALYIIIMDSVTYAPFRVTKVINYVFRPYWEMVRSLLT